MWEFLRNIYTKRDRKITVVVLDDADPESSSSFKIKAADIIRTGFVLVLISIVLTTIIFFITPLGEIYQQRQDERLRQDIIDISEQVISLRDSLYAQDQQLFDIKQILMRNPDTTFTPRFSANEENLINQYQYDGMLRMTPGEIQAYEMLSSNEIIFSDILKNAPEFPTQYPVQGDLTQNFRTDEGHYGIDIAATTGTEFMSVADGTVINASWTINYGYVIYVQHGNGYTSVYKHVNKLLKRKGDIVLKGDVLGTVGDTGVLSYGPHLHFEIWKNGVAQNPLMYLI